MNRQLYQVHPSLSWKAIIVLIVLLLFALMWAPAAALGQHGQGIQDSTHHAAYDVNTVVTLAGKISRIDQLPGRMQGMVGVHAILENETEAVEVHLGPYMYLSKQTLQLKEGEGVEVTGSRIMHEGEPALLAREVRRGNEVLILRDEEGRPAWKGMMHQGKGKHKKHGKSSS